MKRILLGFQGFSLIHNLCRGTSHGCFIGHFKDVVRIYGKVLLDDFNDTLIDSEHGFMKGVIFRDLGGKSDQ